MTTYPYTVPSPKRSCNKVFPSGQKLTSSGKDLKYGSLIVFVAHSGKFASIATTCPSPNVVCRTIAPAGTKGASSGFCTTILLMISVALSETVASIYCFHAGASSISRLDSHLRINSLSCSGLVERLQSRPRLFVYFRCRKCDASFG